MKLLGSIRAFFRLTDEDKAIYYNEIVPDNAKRGFIISLIGIPVSLFHLAVFISRLDGAVGIEQKWIRSIIFSHVSLFVLSVCFSVLLYLFLHGRRKRVNAACSTTKVMLYILLIWGACITAFDQYVTPAITPFVNISIIVGLIFQMRPTISSLYFFTSYLFFYVAVSRTQVNQEMLVSNQVNGLSITIIGLCLSMILWSSKLTRIKQREQIIRQNRILHESNAEKDKFFSIIAHDLKSPFNAILGFSDLLIQQLKVKNYIGMEEYANYINLSSKSAMDLLSNLMDWSKAQTGRMEFRPEKIILRDVLMELEHLFAGSLLQKQQRLIIDIPDKTVVFADRNILQTVLRNLISNAIKFSYPNGRIEIAVEKKQTEYVVSVKDEGVGIPNDYIHKLFQIDKGYSTLGTQQEKGTGLGLVLCKELIGRHGGRIWCESEPKKGSKFSFSIPLKQTMKSELSKS